eukprot:SAG22_NODE_164_length_16817_cov_61.573573_22_plen_551_part_00
MIIACHLCIQTPFTDEAIVYWGNRLLYTIFPMSVALQILLYINFKEDNPAAKGVGCAGGVLLEGWDCWSGASFRQIALFWCAGPCCAAATCAALPGAWPGWAVLGWLCSPRPCPPDTKPSRPWLAVPGLFNKQHRCCRRRRRRCVALPFYYAGIAVWIIGQMMRVPRHKNRMWRALNMESEKDYFVGKKVVIIGNGPSAMTGTPAGNFIDSCDEVVRFNNFNAGGKYAEFVGSKTTIHFSDGMLFPTYPEYKQSEDCTTILSLIKDRVSLGATYWLMHGAIDVCPFSSFKFLMSPSTWWTPEEQIAELRDELGIDRHAKAPTSGMLAINMFQRMPGCEVYIHGFDFFMGKKLHYYDDDEPLYERMNDKMGVNFHGPNQERPVVAKLVQSGRVKFIPGVKDKVYCVIPARSGSKGVPGKNIKEFCGRPLMAWAIDAALKSETVSRVFVSTDSPEYQAVALKWGAECPFLRPKDISHGTSTDLECYTHFLEWLKEEEGEEALPNYVVQLRPTAPLNKASAVDAAVRHMLSHELMDYDSLRSVTTYDHEAYNS